MRKTLFLLSFIILCDFAGAQTSLSPDIIAANGGVNKYSDIELEWTLGESAIGLATTSNRFYTVGFHQPLLTSRQLDITENDALTGVRVFPNPVSNVLKVQFQLRGNENIKLILTDLMGNNLLEKTVSGKSANAEISVGHLISGIYQFRVVTASGNQAGVFKIIKVN